MLSSGHEHSFICSLSFNVIAVFEKNNKKVHSHSVLLSKKSNAPPNRDISFTKRHESRPCRLFLDLISIHKCWVLEGWSFIESTATWCAAMSNVRAQCNPQRSSKDCDLFPIHLHPASTKKKCTQTSLYMQMEDAPKLHFYCI